MWICRLWNRAGIVRLAVDVAFFWWNTKVWADLEFNRGNNARCYHIHCSDLVHQVCFLSLVILARCLFVKTRAFYHAEMIGVSAAHHAV